MDGVTVYGVGIDLLMVVEDTVAPERTGADNVTVCENVPAEGEYTLAWSSTSVANSVHLKTYPRFASTTKPVASLVSAGSVSNEQVMQKRMDTTLRTTRWMVSCHSAVSALPVASRTGGGPEASDAETCFLLLRRCSLGDPKRLLLGSLMLPLLSAPYSPTSPTAMLSSWP